MKRALLLVLGGCGSAAGTAAIGNAPSPVCAGPSGAVEEIALDRPERPGHVDAIDGLPVWLGASDLLAMVHADEASTIYAVVQARGCGVEVPCRPEVIRVVDNLVVDRVAVPAAETIAPAPSPFELEWAALEDHDADGTKELWLGYAITSIQDAATWRMRFYAIFGAAPLVPRFYGEHTALPTSPTGWECHHTGLRAVDADCDGAPDLLMDQTCQMLQCLAEAPPPGCTAGTAFHAVSHHQADGSYRAEVTSEAL